MRARTEGTKAMRRCWRDAGLTEDGARRADTILAGMVKLVERAGGEVARLVLKEARFRVEQLPKLTPAFQSAYINNDVDIGPRRTPAKQNKAR
jgi:hypothetical protein